MVISLSCSSQHHLRITSSLELPASLSAYSPAEVDVSRAQTPWWLPSVTALDFALSPEICVWMWCKWKCTKDNIFDIHVVNETSNGLPPKVNPNLRETTQCLFSKARLTPEVVITCMHNVLTPSTKYIIKSLAWLLHCSLMNWALLLTKARQFQWPLNRV